MMCKTLYDMISCEQSHRIFLYTRVWSFTKLEKRQLSQQYLQLFLELKSWSLYM